MFDEAFYSNKESDGLFSDVVIQEAFQVITATKRHAMFLQHPVFIAV